MYSVPRCIDPMVGWMVSWTGFGRTRSWHNRHISAYAWTDWGKLRKTSITIIYVPAEISRGYRPNASLEPYRYGNLLVCVALWWLKWIWPYAWHENIWSVEDKIHSFLTSALGESEWLISHLGRFPRRNKNLVRIYFVAAWVPKLAWTFRKRKKSFPYLRL